MESYSLKCIIELQDYIQDYDCISCEVSKKYWKAMTDQKRKQESKKPREWEEEDKEKNLVVTV